MNLRNIIGMDERRTFDYFFAKPSQGSKHDCRQFLVTSVMSARKEKSSGKPTSKNGRKFRRVAIRSALPKELVLGDCFYVKSKHIFQFLFNW